MPYEEQELEDGLLHDWLSLTIPNGWGWAIVNKGNKILVYPPVADTVISFSSIHAIELFFARHINQ